MERRPPGRGLVAIAALCLPDERPQRRRRRQALRQPREPSTQQPGHRCFCLAIYDTCSMFYVLTWRYGPYMEGLRISVCTDWNKLPSAGCMLAHGGGCIPAPERLRARDVGPRDPDGLVAPEAAPADQHLVPAAPAPRLGLGEIAGLGARTPMGPAGQRAPAAAPRVGADGNSEPACAALLTVTMAASPSRAIAAWASGSSPAEQSRADEHRLWRLHRVRGAGE